MDDNFEKLEEEELDEVNGGRAVAGHFSLGAVANKGVANKGVANKGVANKGIAANKGSFSNHEVAGKTVASCRCGSGKKHKPGKPDCKHK